jgi:hypothetical protein
VTPGAPAKMPRVPRRRQLEQIILETSRYRIEGQIMLPPEGYRSRLSDYLNDPNREFLIVLDARVTRLDDPNAPTAIPVLMVQRARVDLIFPLET